MYRKVVINAPTGDAQVSTKYPCTIYSYLIEYGCDHDTAANVVEWAQVAGIGEEYELDGFEIYITD